jgi:hypothetical protein
MRSGPLDPPPPPGLTASFFMLLSCCGSVEPQGSKHRHFTALPARVRSRLALIFINPLGPGGAVRTVAHEFDADRGRTCSCPFKLGGGNERDKPAIGVPILRFVMIGSGCVAALRTRRIAPVQHRRSDRSVGRAPGPILAGSQPGGSRDRRSATAIADCWTRSAGTTHPQ